MNNGNLHSELRRHGHRLTRQRRLVLDILRASNEHLNAESLYELARHQDKKISLATIYRSLAVLKDLGFVEEHNLGENHAHFETIRKSPHYHFTCLHCGQVTEIGAPQVFEIIAETCRQRRLQMQDISLHVKGVCADCADQDQDKENNNVDAQ